MTKCRSIETLLLVLLFFVYAGDEPPMVNEAHYLVKAKNFWQPDWCSADLFASSGKAHTTFYILFGWPTRFVSLSATAWIGRFVGWWMLAIGLRRLCDALISIPFASIAVAVLWIVGVEYGNLAGEWVVGGIEAKVPAYGLVLMGLAELVRRRWNHVWLYLGAASAFHVLTGGWAVIAAMVAWMVTEFRSENRQPFFTLWLFMGGALSLFGLVPAVWLTMGVSADAASEAAKIYSYFRLRHHLLPTDFYLQWYLRHGVVLVILGIGIAIYFRVSSAYRRLYAFTLGVIFIAIGGLVVGVMPPLMPDLAAKLLRYYWFRLSDAIVPLTMALIVTQMATDARTWARRTGITMLAVSIGLFGYSVIDRARIKVPPSVGNRLLGWDADTTAKQQESVYLDWLKVCYWAAHSTGTDEVFLTPRHQQTFKWYAGRAEVVNWKDVPQDATSLREWRRRFEEIFPARLGSTRVTIGYEKLRAYRKQYGVRFMITDRRVVGEHLPLVRLYPLNSDDNATFAVYELPR